MLAVSNHEGDTGQDDSPTEHRVSHSMKTEYLGMVHQDIQLILESSMDDILSSFIQTSCLALSLKDVRSCNLTPMTEKEAVATLTKCFHCWKQHRQQRHLQEIVKKNKGRLLMAAYLKQQPAVSSKPDKDRETHFQEAAFVRRLEGYFRETGTAHSSLNEKAAMYLYGIILADHRHSTLESLLGIQGFGLFLQFWQLQRPIRCVDYFSRSLVGRAPSDFSGFSIWDCACLRM